MFFISRLCNSRLSIIQVGAKIWVPSVTRHSSLGVGEDSGGTLHEEEVKRTTITAAVDEERISTASATVASSNTTILGHEAGDGNVGVASDVSLVEQQHIAEASAAVASEVAPQPACEQTVRTKSRNEGDNSVLEAAAAITAVEMKSATKQLVDDSSQSSHLREFPSSPPYRYTRAQLLCLRPEIDQHQRKQQPIESPPFHSMEASSTGRRNERFHKYSGNGWQHGGGGQHHELHHHIRNSSYGKPEEGERCDHRSSMDKHYVNGILEQRQQNRQSMRRESQGNSIGGDSTLSATDDFEPLLVTENRYCCSQY